MASTPVSCTLFRLTNGIEVDDLKETAEGFDEKVEDENATALIDNNLVDEDGFTDDEEIELRITTTELRKSGSRLRCTIEYDTLKPRGHRAGEKPYYRDVERANVEFSENLFEDGGFVVLGGQSKALSSTLHIKQILGISSEGYERAKISTETIEEIVDEDSEESKTRTVENPDEYTDTVSVAGNVDETGSMGAEAADGGSTTWEMYRSLDYGGMLGVGTKSVVFYSSLWELEQRMNYLENQVCPKIEF